MTPRDGLMTAADLPERAKKAPFLSGVVTGSGPGCRLGRIFGAGNTMMIGVTCHAFLSAISPLLIRHHIKNWLSTNAVNRVRTMVVVAGPGPPTIQRPNQIVA